MYEEKQKVLKKVNELIDRKRDELLEKLPSIHEIEDGIVIRFFTEWDNCEDDNQIKFKIVKNENPDESVVFFYLPKDSYFKLDERFFIGCMTCLSGNMEVNSNGTTKYLDGYSKICVNSSEVEGRVFENTYLITTSNRNEWSDKTTELVKAYL